MKLMPSEVRAFQRELRPGYELEAVPNRMTRWFIRDPEGQILTAPDGSPIVIGRAETIGSLKKLRAWLEKAGALDKQVKRTSHMRHEPVEKPRGSSNPILMAQTILRDTKATPRERKMAREYLALMTEHDAVRKLAQNLGHQLKEHAAQEPRQVYI